jgi:hypothetical protein
MKKYFLILLLLIALNFLSVGKGLAEDYNTKLPEMNDNYSSGGYNNNTSYYGQQINYQQPQYQNPQYQSPTAGQISNQPYGQSPTVGIQPQKISTTNNPFNNTGLPNSKTLNNSNNPTTKIKPPEQISKEKNQDSTDDLNGKDKVTRDINDTINNNREGEPTAKSYRFSDRQVPTTNNRPTLTGAVAKHS